MKSIFKYFKCYQHYLQKRIYIFVFLNLLVAALDSFGVAFLIPSLSLIIPNSPQFSEQLFINDIFYSTLNFLGLDKSFSGALIFLLILFSFKGVITFLALAYKSYLKAWLLKNMRQEILGAYSNMSYEKYIQKSTGHFVNIINSELNQFSSAFDSYTKFLTALMFVFAYLALSFTTDWKFTLLSISAGLFLYLFFKKINKEVRKLSRTMVTSNRSLNHKFVQVIQSFKYLVSTNTIKNAQKGLSNTISYICELQLKVGYAMAITKSIREPFAVFVIVLLLFIQFTFISSHISATLVSLLLIYRTLNQIISIQLTWQSFTGAVGSIEHVEAELKDATSNCFNNKDLRIKDFSFNNSLSLKEVSFSYGNKKIIDNVSISIKKNSTVAFVGASGSGKTTLVDLLTLLLKPTRGDIYIDDISTTNICEESWRSNIALVTQEMAIFDDTVANNIVFAKSDGVLDLDRVKQAAADANAEDFIENLPDKYETIVGDRGVLLSGGQRQRLFIARELYKRPELLILDEATSALDGASESLIKESINNLKGKVTVIIVAHRLSTIRDADCIYVLDKGKVVEQGSYKELYKLQDGYFRALIKSQL